MAVINSFPTINLDCVRLFFVECKELANIVQNKIIYGFRFERGWGWLCRHALRLRVKPPFINNNKSNNKDKPVNNNNKRRREATRQKRLWERDKKIFQKLDRYEENQMWTIRGRVRDTVRLCERSIRGQRRYRARSEAREEQRFSVQVIVVRFSHPNPMLIAANIIS